MWQGGHARVGLGGMTKFVLLVVASAAVILSKFSLSTLLLTSRSFVINSPYESLKFAEKFSLSGWPFLIAEELKAEESYPIGFSLGGPIPDLKLECRPPFGALSFASLQVTFFDKCRALKMTGGRLSRSHVPPPVWLVRNQVVVYVNQSERDGVLLAGKGVRYLRGKLLELGGGGGGLFREVKRFGWGKEDTQRELESPIGLNEAGVVNRTVFMDALFWTLMRMKLVFGSILMDLKLHIGISSENLLFLMVNLSTQPELEVSVAGGGLSWKYGDFVTCKENEGNEERREQELGKKAASWKSQHLIYAFSSAHFVGGLRWPFHHWNHIVEAKPTNALANGEDRKSWLATTGSNRCPSFPWSGAYPDAEKRKTATLFVPGRNIPGVEVANVDRLNLLKLAPGGHLGRNSQLGPFSPCLSQSPAKKSGFGSANSGLDAPNSPRIFN
ncbi:hypothetical protein CK203_114125 [Vitis vinifera]|uniref:Uncharacterized protein n=1 Tax=Vitis vinifera TaxID=29760 RepID=A0A438FCR3_VITVI|nr:hypothetical protein CK203_114125 [Vitis vinifera]